jgi:hypothetical protein
VFVEVEIVADQLDSSQRKDKGKHAHRCVVEVRYGSHMRCYCHIGEQQSFLISLRNSSPSHAMRRREEEEEEESGNGSNGT